MAIKITITPFIKGSIEEVGKRIQQYVHSKLVDAKSMADKEVGRVTSNWKGNTMKTDIQGNSLIIKQSKNQNALPPKFVMKAVGSSFDKVASKNGNNVLVAQRQKAMQQLGIIRGKSVPTNALTTATNASPTYAIVGKKSRNLRYAKRLKQRFSNLQNRLKQTIAKNGTK